MKTMRAQSCLRGRIPLLVLAILIASVTAHADTISVSHTFQTQAPQSMWGPDPFLFTYNQFHGVNWNRTGSAGGVSCGFLGCFGAELTGATSGRIGVNVGIRLDGGSVAARIPANIGLGFPDLVFPGRPITFDSSVLFGVGQLNTASPTFNAFVDGQVRVFASAGARSCVVGCLSAQATLVSINETPELVSFNRNNNGQLRLITQPPVGLDQALRVSNPIVSATVEFPSIQTQGSGTTVIRSSGADQFLDLQANVVNLLTSALGLPPLSGSLGPFSYNIVSAGVGLDFLMSQAFTFTPQALIQLNVRETGQSFLFNAGQPFSFAMPKGFDQIHITPIFHLLGPFSNMTDMTLLPNIFASGGFFSAFGLGIGPLFNASYNPAMVGIPVFRSAFTLGGFDSVQGSTFAVAAVPEPGTLLLLGTGAAVLSARMRRVRRTPVPGMRR